MGASAQPYIGLMSGTSLDGIDGVLVEFGDEANAGVLALRVLGHAHLPFPEALAAELLALNTRGGSDELHRAALAANALARRSAEVVERLLASAGLRPADVAAIGSHGQTVRHRPQQFDSAGYTLQLDNPALLAELTGIDVIADFRSRDVAAGGQGAPLVPAFHRAAFASASESLVVLNIGGMSNLTALPPDGATIGFDCGPGNALLDAWCQRERGWPFDNQGMWARSGQVIEPLLASLRADPYFTLAPPKSTGRDHFDSAWLDASLHALAPPTRWVAADVQATLVELTASVCADAIEGHAATAGRVIVCGGGALNAFLLERLQCRLAGRTVLPSDSEGLPAQQVEATAFAWLARAWHRRTPGNLPAVTGAKGPRVLGALYPAR